MINKLRIFWSRMIYIYHAYAKRNGIIQIPAADDQQQL